jgi:putative restriction endonuclease
LRPGRGYPILAPCRFPSTARPLIARFEGSRQFTQGGRRAPHKPLLLLYALARLKHDRQAEVKFSAAEAVLRPLLRTYGPWGGQPRVAYPYGRLITDGL